MGNKGIIISGGNFNASHVAVGDRASIFKYGEREQEKLLEKIEQLLVEIRAANLPHDQYKNLVSATNNMKEEAEKTTPNKTVMEKSLSFIETATSSVSRIIPAVKVVKEIVAMLI
jgi:uncharacterized protein YaaN involved in tellurite resistance